MVDNPTEALPLSCFLFKGAKIYKEPEEIVRVARPKRAQPQPSQEQVLSIREGEEMPFLVKENELFSLEQITGLPLLQQIEPSSGPEEGNFPSEEEVAPFLPQEEEKGPFRCQEQKVTIPALEEIPFLGQEVEISEFG